MDPRLSKFFTPDVGEDIVQPAEFSSAFRDAAVISAAEAYIEACREVRFAELKLEHVIKCKNRALHELEMAQCELWAKA